MRRLWTWALVFLAGVIVVGCAVAPRLISISDSTQRLEFQGFSILPPRGENWFVVEASSQPDPNLTYAVVFSKRLRERVTRPAELHTITASVSTSSLGDVTFESRTELLQYLAREREKGWRRPTQRHTPLEVKVSLEKCLGWDCVRIDYTAEDYGVPHFPGLVFILTGYDFIFLHPDTPTFVIYVNYGQRYLRGQQPLPLEAEVKSFLKSLAFTPIR